jgi:hypothetical protein
VNDDDVESIWKKGVRDWFLRYYPNIHLEGLRKTSSQDTRSPSQDLKPGPPEYEAGVLAARPRRLQLDYWFTWNVIAYVEKCDMSISLRHICFNSQLMKFRVKLWDMFVHQNTAPLKWNGKLITSGIWLSYGGEDVACSLLSCDPVLSCQGGHKPFGGSCKPWGCETFLRNGGNHVMMIISIDGWDCVSKLRPPTGLLSIH